MAQPMVDFPAEMRRSLRRVKPEAVIGAEQEVPPTKGRKETLGIVQVCQGEGER